MNFIGQTEDSTFHAGMSFILLCFITAGVNGYNRKPMIH